MNQFQIRQLNEVDNAWVTRLLEEHWGSTKIVTRGQVYHADNLPGIIAIQDDKPVGLLIYCLNEDECQIVSMNSLIEGMGIGSALMEAVRTMAASVGSKRLWLITTNDNTSALRFYQKKGFRLVAIYPDALKESRVLKPEIPLTGMNGIPLRDEIELELIL